MLAGMYEKVNCMCRSRPKWNSGKTMQALHAISKELTRVSTDDNSHRLSICQVVFRLLGSDKIPVRRCQSPRGHLQMSCFLQPAVQNTVISLWSQKTQKSCTSSYRRSCNQSLFWYFCSINDLTKRLIIYQIYSF